MATQRPLRQPKLGVAGAALWRKLTAAAPGEVVLFSASEQVVLEQACRQADDVRNLERALARDGVVVAGSKGQPKLSGLVTELRLSRAALARLVLQLAIPDEVGELAGTPASAKAQRAAQARWAREARRKVVKHG